MATKKLTPRATKTLERRIHPRDPADDARAEVAAVLGCARAEAGASRAGEAEIEMTFDALIFWLLVGHAVADYPLQGDFLSKAKNHRAPLPGIDWWIALGAHAAIHAGAVALITQSIFLGVCEFVAHCFIDFLKCDGRTTFRADQVMHVICKLMWVFCLLRILK